MNRGFLVSDGLADRMIETIRRVESTPYGTAPNGTERLEDWARRPNRVRLCKTTAAWLYNTEATLDVWERGEPLNEEQSMETESQAATLVAYNKSYDVASCVWVFVAKARNGNWYLVEAATPDPSESGCRAPNIGGHDLTTVSGYDAAKKQALTHDQNACLKWVDIEECS